MSRQPTPVAAPADIDEWSRRMATAFDEAARGMGNESEFREHVHAVVMAAISDLYSMTAAASSAERSPNRSSRMRYDRLYAGVAVEWEWDMRAARREHGAQQALDYLALLRDDHAAPDAFTAVVADGAQWGFLVVDPAAEQDLFSEGPASATEHFLWRDNSPAACRQFLELIGSHGQSPITPRSLTATFGPSSELAHRFVSVLAQSLAGRSELDRSDTLYREWRRALDVVYGDLDSADGSLADVVQNAYDVPVSRSVGELLFVIHTYFALTARLIAVELLATSANDPEGRPAAWRGLADQDLVQRLARLDGGDLPGGLVIGNLFESDLFSWWTALAEGNADLLGVVRELLSAMTSLAFPRVVFGPAPAADVLRDLYQSLVPRELRRALGEFLTPTWLAQACLERLGEAGANLTDGRVLDPTCGTGTFLLPVLTRRLHALKAGDGTPTAEQVQAVLNSVCGVDLNPVAVTAARVNYVIALGDLASSGPLTLPIWRADSLLVPDAPPAQGRLDGELAGLSYRELPTSLAEPFSVPLTLAKADRLGTLRHILEESLPPQDGPAGPTVDLDAYRDDYATRLAEKFSPTGTDPATDDPQEWDGDARVALVLYGQLADLSRAGRNGVWARIIENAFAPLFAGTFDVVVGNPPWLTWTKLPGPWRDASKRIWMRYGLWRAPAETGSSFSLASTDVCTLVFAVALDRYVGDNGWVGLLTPDSLLTADPGGRAFRRFHLKPDPEHTGDTSDVPFRVLFADDWSQVRPFAPEAANRPVFLVTRRGENQHAETPGARWSRLGRGDLGPTWATARAQVQSKTGTYRPVDPSTPTSAWSFQPEGAPPLIAGGTNGWEFGKGLDTRGANGVYFLRLIESDRQRSRVTIENLPAEGRNRAVVTARGAVEAPLVYPLLRGRDVQSWTAKPSVYFLLPHEPDALQTVLDAQTLRTQYPNAYRWLGRHRDALTARRFPPTRSWNMDGDDWCRVDGPLQHMAGSHLVVVREQQARPAAAVVESRMSYDLGRATAPLIDHKLLFCSVPTLAEALYLTAMINCTPVQDLLASYANTTAVSPTTLRRLPIPAYDSGSELQTPVIETANSIVTAEDPAATARLLQDQLDEHAVRVLQVEGYQAQPRRAAAQRRVALDAGPDADVLF